jgi:hypothetical protein
MTAWSTPFALVEMWTEAGELKARIIVAGLCLVASPLEAADAAAVVLGN